MTHSLTLDWPLDGVAVLTFSDSERNNQLCWAAVDDMAVQLRDCREAGARVVVLASGLSGHWLEHAWLRDLGNGLEGREQTGAGTGWFTLPKELGHEDMISIAAISGDSSGGGAELGWACDLRIAEEQARFSQPEVHMGLTTGIGGCSRLLRLIGRAATAEMVLTGRPLGARRLYELGALNRVVAQGGALSAALDYAALLVTKSPGALSGLKRILAKAGDLPLDEALAHEQAVFQSVVVGEDARAGMRDTQDAYDNGASVAVRHDYSRWSEA